MILSFVFLALAIACYSISQLQQHEKLRWGARAYYSFWGAGSWIQKYKGHKTNKLEPAPSTWYYKFFKLKYKERFPLSATFLVSLTDGYHLTQFFFFLFLSLSVSFAIGFTWWLAMGIWIGIHAIHFTTYKLLSK